ncbi:MAG TPA: hypothetical protein VIL09_02500 [Microvirga sp.]
MTASTSDAPLIVIDSIAALEPAHAGAVAVTGSHGGASAARYALSVPLRGVVFNDAGGGKDRAGIAALALLDEAGVPAAAVSHLSARIGDAADTLESGRIAHVNEAAARAGMRAGQTTQEAVRRLTIPSPSMPEAVRGLAGEGQTPQEAVRRLANKGGTC